MVLSQSQSESELDLRSKPLKKRGLSRFYRSKAQSFASFESLIACRFGDSSLLLAKRPQSASDDASPPQAGKPLDAEASWRHKQSKEELKLCKALRGIALAGRPGKQLSPLSPHGGHGAMHAGHGAMHGGHGAMHGGHGAMQHTQQLTLVPLE